MEYPKLDDAALGAVIAYHQQITAKSFGPAVEEVALSDRARKAARLLNSGVFNCHTRQTATLLDILLEEPVSRHVNSAAGGGQTGPQHISGAMLTAVNNVSGLRNGITYMIANTNRDGSAKTICADGSTVGPAHPVHFRQATPDEVAAFFTERNGGEPQQGAPEPLRDPIEDEMSF